MLLLFREQTSRQSFPDLGIPKMSQKLPPLGSVTTGTPEHPAFPAQWFYGLLRALPGDRAFLSPSSAEMNSRQLDAGVEAPGTPHFAARESRSRLERRPRPPHPAPRR